MFSEVKQASVFLSSHLCVTVNMYFCIKSNFLKMVRTLPTIWILIIDGSNHCWIPKVGYSHKLKNLVPPPNETDVKAREEWYFSECEILFGRGKRLFINYVTHLGGRGVENLPIQNQNVQSKNVYRL